MPFLEAFNAVVKERFLHGTIRKLGNLPETTEQELRVLEQAKDARNYIAHEGAMFFASSSKWLIIARLKMLREEVSHLAHGANLVSLWSYEIENREPGPRWDIFSEYPEMVDRWVFGDLLKVIEELGDCPEVKRSEELLQGYEKAIK